MKKNLKRAALIDSNGQTYLSIGYRDNRYWPNFTEKNNFLVQSLITTTIFMDSGLAIHQEKHLSGSSLKWTISH